MSAKRAEFDLLIGCHGDAGGWGGAALAALELARACRAAGWRPLLLGMGTSQPAQDDATDVPRHNVDISPRGGWWRLHQWHTPHVLARALRQFPRPAEFVSFSPFWTVAARRVWPDLPVIARYCGLLHHAADRVHKLNGRPLGFWERINHLGVIAVERRALRVANVVLASSPEHIIEIMAFEPRAAERIKEVPDGCTRFEPTDAARTELRRRLGLTDADFAILLCGSCDANKAFDHAIAQMPRVAPSGRLLIVGDGPTRAALERLTAELNLTTRVYFLGRVPDLAAVYAAADCVASTSFYDTFPNVIKEAMWSGRPVLVPEHDPPEVSAGISGLIRRHGGGLLYDRRRDGSMAEVINELMRNPHLARQLGRQAAETARSRFDWQNTVNEIGNATMRRRSCATPSAGADAAGPSTSEIRSAPPPRNLPCDRHGLAECAATPPDRAASTDDNPAACEAAAACDAGHERRP